MFSTKRRRHVDARTVACRDNTGRRSRLLITFDDDHLVLSQPFGVSVVLTPLQAGQLRAGLRDLLRAADERA